LLTFLRTAIILAAFSVGFLLGYSISSDTGVEPGYFEAAETGAYGSALKPPPSIGISEEDEEYYKSLSDE